MAIRKVTNSPASIVAEAAEVAALAAVKTAVEAQICLAHTTNRLAAMPDQIAVTLEQSSQNVRPAASEVEMDASMHHDGAPIKHASSSDVRSHAADQMELDHEKQLTRPLSPRRRRSVWCCEVGLEDVPTWYELST